MPNIFTGLWGRLKNLIIPQTAIERAFHVQPAVSNEMQQNISLWYSMYVNSPPWATCDIRSLGIPAAIARELARPALVEFNMDITGSSRADYLNTQAQRAKSHFKYALELGLSLGGVALKPYVHGNQIMMDVTSATAFHPTKFDSGGNVVGGVFKERIKSSGNWYERLEYHDLNGLQYTIQNRAYRSDSAGILGEEVDLKIVPEWADVPPIVQLDNIEFPLFAYFKPPNANAIDPASPVGASVYGGAVVDLIRQADEQWDMIQWEYKSGERKLMIDDAQVNMNRYGENRLYGFMPTSNVPNEPFREFTPAYRDEPLYRGFQNILKQIEFQVGLSYGTISDPQTVEKTATEIKSSKQRMYVTVADIQTAFQHTIDNLVYAMDVYATLYHLAPSGSYEVVYDWGDGVLNDDETINAEFNRGLQMVQAGIMNDWEFRMKWMGEDEETAKRMLPEMTQLVGSST